MYNIRMAVPEDFHKILPMAHTFIGSAKEFEGMPVDVPSILEHYISMLEYGFVLVAEDGDELVGMLGTLVGPFPFNRNVIVCTECMWWVSPDYRHKGLAGEMMRMAEEEARSAGCHKFVMSALGSSPEKVGAYYQSKGYAPYETAYVRSI